MSKNPKKKKNKQKKGEKGEKVPNFKEEDRRSSSSTSSKGAGRSRSSKGSRARADLAERIRKVQSSKDYDPYKESVDAMDKALKDEINDIEKMRDYLLNYRGEHPLLLRYSKEMTKRPSWIPTLRERTLFYSIVRSRGGWGNLGTITPKEYVRRMDEDGFDDDEPDSLSP